jgi:Flp pilus assembly protein TadD
MRSAVQEHGDDAEVCLRAAIIVGEPDPGFAQVYARRAADLRSDDPGMQFRAGAALFNAGDIGGASELADKAAKLDDETFPLLEEMLNLVGDLQRIGRARR